MMETKDEACTCGHSPEEHGHDPKYPGSTACTECDCVAYECCEDHDESGRACPNRDSETHACEGEGCDRWDLHHGKGTSGT